MEPSPTFMKARVVAFSCILLTSLLWALLLCLFVFFRWEVSSSLQRSLVVIMLCTNAITVVMVPLLLLLQFRVWLDVARLLLLLVLHIGSAAAFSYCNAYFTCTNQTPDQEGVCTLINIYILLASWVIPVLLLLYAAGLGYMLYRRSKMAPTGGDAYATDEEFSITTPSMVQSKKQPRISVPVFGPFAPSDQGVPPWLATSEADSPETSASSSGHLAKVQPWAYAI